jgi:hypothetical protein
MCAERLRGRLAALGLSLLTACAALDSGQALQIGLSSEADVLARLGPPVQIWPEADGGRTLEYSSQPFGTRCRMLRLDAQQRLVAIEEALTPAHRARVQAGMTPEQVSRLLGRERSRVHFAASGEEVWDWTVEPDQSGYGLRFNVHFKDGRVLRTTQSMVFRDRIFGTD